MEISRMKKIYNGGSTCALKLKKKTIIAQQTVKAKVYPKSLPK
jgi:hypothetical protein